MEVLEERLAPAVAEFMDPNPAPGNQFGHTVMPLSTGNVVITSPFDDFGGTDAGAVYLFNGSTGALISTLRGSSASDNVGNAGVTALSNGNYVVRSLNWDNGAATNAGAVTWGNGVSGVSGVVSAANSLVGSTASDQVGFNGVTALPNGNYVVTTVVWDNGAAASAGAATWGNGTTGVSGVVSAANSLVGTTTGDGVGGSVTVLSNGNYVVSSSGWNDGAATDVGAATWGSGTSGVTGAVSAANSLVGSTNSDGVGSGGIIALTNGNYVVRSGGWDNAGVVNAGAATWGNGTSGTTGVVSAANSLVGSNPSDLVSNGGITPLSNGHYVVRSPNWNGTATNAGAVTWGNGAGGTTGVVSAANSAVGSVMNDNLANSGVVALSNGNYVFTSRNWDNAGVVDAGAVTWASGTSGLSGPLSAANSLVGSTTNDAVGSGSVTALSNGHYVVVSRNWDNAGVVDVGAVTWANGATGIVGVITAANSLVGSTLDDEIGSGGIVVLSNGNYVVRSSLWNNGAVVDAGAATWASGTGGVVGAVSAANSLVGSTLNDQVSSGGVIPLSNGNYVVVSQTWNNGAVTDAGAATWGNGAGGSTGAVNAANSLVGSTNFDMVGPATALTNGNYVVNSVNWNNGAVADVGAVTWGNGAGGTTGALSAANSLIGSTANDRVGSGGITPLTNGNYVVNVGVNWSNAGASNAGAVAWGNGTSGVAGVVSAANSLVGTQLADSVGNSGVTALSNGNYIVASSAWKNGALTSAGAITWGNGATGIVGAVSSSNSAIGLTASAGLQSTPTLDSVNDAFYGSFRTDDNGKVRGGSQTTGFVFGTISAALDGSNNLVITDTDGVGKNNSLTIANSGGVIQFTDANEQFTGTGGISGAFLSNGNKTLNVPVGSISAQIIVNGGLGNDTLTVNFTGGSPLAGGIVYNGQGGFDSAAVTGGTFGAVVHKFTAAGGGNVDFNNNGTPDLTYTGLEPFLMTSGVADLVLDVTSAGVTDAILRDYTGIGDAGHSELAFTSNSAEDFQFTVPTNSLKVITHGGSVVQLQNLDAGFATLPSLILEDTSGTDSLFVDQGNFVPDGTDLTLTGANAVLDLNGSSDTIDGLNGTGRITNNAAAGTATLTVNGGGAFSGVIQNGATASTALTVGGGTLVLSGNNTHSGGTTVNAGTLHVQTSFSGGANLNPLGTGPLTNNGASVIISQGSAAAAPRGATGNLSMSWFDTGAATALITNIGNNTATGGLLGVAPLGTKHLAGAINFGSDAAFQTSTATPGSGLTLTAGDNYMFLYRGYFTPSVTGTYQFGVGSQAGGGNIDDEAAIYFDTNADGLFNTAGGERVAYQASSGGSNAGATVNLTAGVAYPIAIAFREATGGAVMIANVQRTAGAPTVGWTNINSSTGSGVGTFTAHAAPNGAAYSPGNAVSVSGAASIETQIDGVSFGALSMAAGSTLNLNGAGAGVNETVVFSSAALAAAATLNTNTANSIIPGIVSQTTAATFTKGGANLLYLGGANTYAGATDIVAGTVSVGNSNAFGTIAGGTNVASGATILINGLRIGPDGDEPLTVAGAGVGGNGAIVNTRTATPLAVIRNLTLSGAATLNSTSRFDIRDDTTNTVTFDMNGNTLTKIGGAELCIVYGTAQGAIVDPGSVNVNAGIFRLESAADFDGAGIINVANGATLDFWQNTQSHTVNVTLAGGANLTTNDGTGAGPTLTGTITLNGIANFNLEKDSTFSGQITGTGGFSKVTGTGALTLTNNTNNYTGIVNVSAGILRVPSTASNALGSTAAGTIVNSPGILELNGNFTLPAEPILINGAGTGSGALLATGNVNVPGRVGLGSNATIGATAGNTLTLNGTLHKEVPSNLTFAGAGNIIVNSAIGDADYMLAPFTALAYNNVTNNAIANNPNINTTTVINNYFTGAVAATRTAVLNAPLTFANAAAFNALFVPSIPLADNFTTIFHATLTVATPGTYSFAASNNDDGAAVWLKPAANATFAAGDLLQGIVANSNTAIATRVLAAGTYTLLYVHREATGSEAMTGRIQGPILVGQTNATLLATVNPAATTTGTNNVVVNGAGTVTFNAPNTYSGSTTVNNGTLRITSGSALSDSAAVIVAPAGTLNVVAGETIGSLEGAGMATIASGQVLTTGGNNASTLYRGAIAGLGGVTKAGTGTWTLGGANTFSGDFTISGGTVALETYAAAPVAGSQVWLDGADLNGDSVSNNPANGTAVSSWVNKGSLTGVNATQATAANQPTVLAAGINGRDVVRFNRATAIDFLDLNNASLAAMINGPHTYFAVARTNNGGADDGAANNDAQAIYATPGNHTDTRFVGGATSGATSIVSENWHGTVTGTINGSHPYVQGNTVVVTSAVNEDGAGSSLQQYYLGVPSALSSTANQLNNYTNNLIRLGAANTSGTFIWALTGEIAELVFYPTFLSASDRLAVENYLYGKWMAPTNVLPDTARIVVGGGATLNLSGRSETIGSLAGAGSVTSAAAGAVTLTLGADGTTGADFSGILDNGAGTVSLVKTGAGSQTLSGDNTYTGATTVSNGTLRIAHAAATDSSSGVAVNSGGRFDVAATDAKIANVDVAAGGFLRISSSQNTGNGATVPTAAMDGTLEINHAAIGANFDGLNLANGSTVTSLVASADFASDLTLAGANVNLDSSGAGGSFKLSGALSGLGSGVTKIGANTIELSGASSYTGPTAVNAGTLLVNGSVTSNVTVTSPGILGGSGTITGTVSGNGTFSPGNSPGVMTIIGAFFPGGTVNFEVNSAWTTPGTDFDQYVVTGLVNLTGATLTFTNTNDSTAPTSNSLLKLIDNDGTSDLTTAANSPVDGSVVTIGTRSFRIFYNGGDGNDVVLVENTTPTTLYVDDNFTGGTGTVITDADLGTAGNQQGIMGITAFNTISAALAASAASATIVVNGGSYAETVSLAGTRTLRITGPDLAQAVVIEDLAAAAGTFIALDGTSSLTFGDADSRSIASVISGSGSLVKRGSGDATLSGNNTYSGGTTASQGALLIGHAAGAGLGLVTLNDAGTGSSNTNFQATGAFTVANAITVANAGSGVATIGTTSFNPGAAATFFSGTITLNKATTFFNGTTDRTSYTGPIAGPGAITLTGPATAGSDANRATFDSNANSFTGNISITGSNTKLQLNNTNVIPDTVSIDVAAGNFLYFNTASETIDGLTGAGTLQKHPGVAGLTTFTIGAGNAAAPVFSGAINNGGGTVALVKTGSGTQTLSGASGYSAGTTVRQGTLLLGSATGAGAGLVTLNDGGTGASNTAFQATGAFTVANAITVANAGSGTSTIGTTSFNPGPAATVFSGVITLNKATTFFGGTTDLTSYTNQITGPGAITITGPATAGTETNRTVFASNANDFTGNIAITGSNTKLQLNNTNVIPDTVSIDVAAGNFLYFNTASETIDGLTGAGTVQKHPSVSGLTTFTIGANNAAAPVFTGAIQNGGGTVAIVKTGSGTQSFNGGSGYSAGTTVRQGTLLIGSATGAGTGLVTLNDGGTGASNTNFQATGAFTVTNAITVANAGSGTSTIGTTSFNPGSVATTFSGVITLNKATTFFNGNADRTSYQSQISGSGAITMTGPGTAGANTNRANFDNNANNFTGNISVTGSNTKLQLNNTNVIPNTVSIDVAIGNFLYFNTASETIDGLTGGGTVQKHPSVAGLTTFTIGAGNAATPNFSGTILNGGGTVAIVKTGSGTQSFSGASSYSAGTTVSGGTLLANNTTGSATGSGNVLVSGSATFGGTGAVTGTVTLSGTSRLAPGASVESLATGSFTGVSGTFFDAEIDGTAGAGVIGGHDILVVTGGVSLGGMTLNVSGVYVPTPGLLQSFTIIDNNTGTDPVVGTFAGLPEGAPVFFNGQYLYISYIGGDGNDVVLSTQLLGFGANDTVVLRRLDALQNEYSLNGGAFLAISNTVPFTFVGQGGSDMLYVDTSNGDPIPAGNVTLSGELLRVQKATGPAADAAVYRLGLVTLTGFGDIIFDGTTNVDFLNMASVAVRSTAAADAWAVADGNTATNSGTVPAGYSIAAAADLAVTGTGGGVVVGLRSNTNVTLDTATSDGNDTVTINTSTGAHGNTNFAISTGAGTDSVNVPGSLTVAGAIDISSQNISLAGGTLTAGATVTLNAGGGAITTSGAGIDVVATALSAAATTGIDLDTTVSNLEADSPTGGIVIANTLPLTIGGVSGLNGVRAATSGAIQIDNAGSIRVDVTGDTVEGAAAVTLNANGVAADLVTGGNNGFANLTPTIGQLGAIGSLAGPLTLSAGRDVTIGSGGAYGDVTSGGILQATAGRHFTVTDDTIFQAVGSAALTVNATGNISLSPPSFGFGPVVFGGGAITLSAGGDFTNNGGLPFASVASSGGDITITADNLFLGDGIDAGGGDVFLTATVGAITDISIDAATRVVGDALTATAVSGITIESAVNSVTATTSAAANISIAEADAVTLTSVATTNGTVIVTAGGAMTATSVTGAGAAGAVRLQTTAGDILLGGVSATTAVRLDAAGAVTDNNAAAVNVTAPQLAIQAGAGIGAAGAIETTVTTLAASATGAIQIVNSGALAIGSVTAFATTLAGIASNNNFINLGVGGTLSVNAPMNAGTGASAEIRLKLSAGVTQTAAVTGSALGVNAAGPVNLGLATNDVATFGATNSAGGAAVIYKDANAVALDIVPTGTNDVGYVGGTKAIATNSGLIDIDSVGAGITVVKDLDTTPGSGGTLIVGSNVTINPGVNLNIGAANIELDGFGTTDVIFTGPTVINGNAIFRPSRNIVVRTGASVTGNGNLGLQAGFGQPFAVDVGGLWVQSGSFVTATGTLLLEGRGFYDNGPDVTPYTLDGVVIDGAANSTGALTLSVPDAGQSMFLNSASPIASSAGGVALTSPATILVANTTVNAAGNITASGTIDSLAGLPRNLVLNAATTGNVTVLGAIGLAGAGTAVGNVTLTGVNINTLGIATAGGNTIVATNTGSGAIVGAVSGALTTFTKNGPGSLTLSGGAAANTFTGQTTVNDGALILAKANNTTALAGPVVIGDGSTTNPLPYVKTAILQVNAVEQISDTVSMTFGGSEGRLFVTFGNTETITPITSFAGGDVKIAGTLVTTGIYAQNSGTTTMSGGTLRVGPLGAADFTLAAGATLQGSGTIYTKILTTSGTIDPSSGVADTDFGNASAGTIFIRGNLQMTGTSTTNLDVGTTGSDRLDVGINTALPLPAGSYQVLSNYDIDPFLRGDAAGILGGATELARRGVNDLYNINGTVRFAGTLNVRPTVSSAPLTNNVSYGNSMNFVWRALNLPTSDLNPRGGNLSSLPSDFAVKNSRDVAGTLLTSGTRFDQRYMGSGGQFNAIGQSVSAVVISGTTPLALLTAPAYSVGQAKSVTLTSLTGTAVPDTTIIKVTKQLWNMQKDSHTRVTLTITNSSAVAQTGPFYIELVGIPAGTTVFNAAGTRTSSGKPYLVVPATTIAAGASLTMEVDLLTPGILGKYLTLTTQVLRGGMP